MEDSEKNKIKSELVEWIKQIDDEETLSMVKEVQAIYNKPDSYSKNELKYIEGILQDSDRDIKAGRVIGLEKLNELFDKWKSEVS